MRKAVIGAAVGAIGLAAGFVHAATLAADYQFQQSFASSVGSAPDLTEVNTGTATGGTFVQADVYGQTQYVYSFSGGTEGGEGLQAATAGVISPDTYSIVIDAELEEITQAINKIIDFKNRTTDSGLYIVAGIPTFYNSVTPVGNGLSPLIQGEFGELALTRDSSGTVDVYLNGVSEFSFDDSSSDLATIGDTPADQVLDLFVDDPYTTIVESGLTLENPEGEVARVRLYDGALTPTEVASLVPEPTLLAMPVVGLMLLRRTRRR